ncbi:hypothetical protein [Maridesulfovibrio ferrireducens]|uniref:hypothetical protein n=1 Tax=Maridesulfovibrio ferrireducens TaxID=246191 RepID=UPI001A361880|nr:hypothetical protein [Maridesulfovibrio ferrireducens]MBI9111501.1 hypothetical protein [Maridesulfovibrio ferrireducens]
MRNFFIILILASIICIPISAKCNDSDTSQKSNLTQYFRNLSEVEAALKKIGANLDKIAGSDAQPDRAYALQDLANLCQTSRIQVHSLNSLYSVVNIVKREKEFQSKETTILKEKSGYAYNDFLRRKNFVHDIIVKANDQKLKDLAYILEAQLNIVLKQLKLIKKELK